TENLRITMMWPIESRKYRAEIQAVPGMLMRKSHATAPAGYRLPAAAAPRRSRRAADLGRQHRRKRGCEHQNGPRRAMARFAALETLGSESARLLLPS